MNPALHQLGLAALILGGFALLGGGLVAVTHEFTRESIHAHQQHQLHQQLTALLPPGPYDAPPMTHVLEVQYPALQVRDTDPVRVYRIYQNQQPLALLAMPVARDGYSGSIHLLVGTRADGRLTGVRVLSHRETPGLGDLIELSRSDWLYSFTGRALGDPFSSGWQVRRDGGVFDQFSGATITPRAVVRAVHRWLRYEAEHRQALFTPPEMSP